MQVKKLWRSVTVVLVLAFVIGLLAVPDWRRAHQPVPVVPAEQRASLASVVLKQLAVRPAASKAGYSRKRFSDGWAKVDSCTVRDKIMVRDMTSVQYRALGDCTVETGILDDPYTGKIIHFIRGSTTSSAVQIDHVVAISNTWQTGAQQLTKARREQMYNDSLELLAVDGPANEQKGDGDASIWLPPNIDYVCPYVARQIAVKKKYHLWVTPAERTAMGKVLSGCPEQQVPIVE